jgi:hypothetical protein
MDFSWGSTEIKIVVGSIKIKHSSGSLSEISLLPNPAALDSISSVIQQQGRKRTRVEARLYVTNMSDYNDFVSDMNKGTSKALSIVVSGTSGNYLIDAVGEPEFIRYNIILFDVTWLEV